MQHASSRSLLLLVGMLTSSSQHVYVSDLRVLTYVVCHNLLKLCLFNYLSGIYFEMIDTLNIRVFCNIYQSFKVFRLQRYGISASEVQSPKSKLNAENSKYAEIKICRKPRIRSRDTQSLAFKFRISYFS